MKNNILNDEYLIVMECINEANDYNLKLGDIVYMHPVAIVQNSQRFTDDVNLAWKGSLDDAKFQAKRIYKRGVFMPKIYEITRNIGANIYIDLDK
jgi:hypothetical protein